MGPGGLDALKETSGNRRKSASAFQPKSILKPTIPLSPVRDIPARKSSPSRASRADQSPSKLANEQIDEKIPDTPARGRNDASGLDKDGEQHQSQDTSVNDPEADERSKRKAEIQKQREARRKSLGIVLLIITS